MARPGDGRRGARGPARISRKGAPARGLPAGIRLVHEDDDLIVVDKPAGLLTAGLPGQDVESVFRYVKVRVREQMKRRGTTVWIIHRLDKEASGLLVFAKTERAYEFLKEEFRTKRAHRLYAAVVEGEMGESSTAATQRSNKAEVAGAAVGGVMGRRVDQPLSGTIQNFLIEDENGIVRAVASSTAAKGRGEGDHAKLAVTHWRVARVGRGCTLLQVRLETGRKNQIRVHMQGLGHPIVGDRRYGAATDPVGRVCLHATELGLAHPATGQTMRFSSPVPAEFEKLVGGAAMAAMPSFESPATGAPRAAVERGGTVKQVESPRAGAGVASGTSWDHVAEWYTGLIEDRKSDHHERVILPGTVRLLGVRAGMRVLDVACGQGILSRRLAGLGASVVGVDASEKLVEAARRASSGDIPAPEYLVGDARDAGAMEIGEFDGAACVMALMNIEPMAPVLEGVATRLKAGGVFVGVVLHPAFRAPGQTSWGWTGETRSAERGTRKGTGPRVARPAASSGELRQYRRVDGYLSPGQTPIVMNPGAVAKGKPAVTTMTFHRPIQAYVNAFAHAGLLVDAMEEWPSLRTSQPGPRAAEENRARREIPMFLALRGVKAAARG